MFLSKQLFILNSQQKIAIKCCFVMLAFLLFSCNNTSPEIDKIANSVADLECRAIELKDKRFLLADKIRFAQDTLLHFKSTTDTISLQHRLKEWDIQKELIVTKSLALADTIKLQMAVIIPQYFTDKKKEQEFNLLLDAALKKNGCK